MNAPLNPDDPQFQPEEQIEPDVPPVPGWKQAFRQAWNRAKHGQKSESGAQQLKTQDRTRAALLLVGSVVVLLMLFLGLFSTLRHAGQAFPLRRFVRSSIQAGESPLGTIADVPVVFRTPHVSGPVAKAPEDGTDRPVLGLVSRSTKKGFGKVRSMISKSIFKGVPALLFGAGSLLLLRAQTGSNRAAAQPWICPR
jgi:hypothetical protein